MLEKLLSRLVPTARKPSVPEGLRVYAIGDVHGRADLLADLLRRIADDHASRPPATRHTVFLGDLVDRGPDSRRVIELAMELAARDANVHVLKGNHEEVFLQTLDGDAQSMRLCARIGGRDTLASYGICAEEFDSGSFAELAELAARRVPSDHRAFLEQAQDTLVLGSYLFVHAGIRPDVALANQSLRDLRWIRGEFLDFEGEFEKIVVHGHSISAKVEECPHRIGIDTGAYRTGTLTALALEGDRRWFLEGRSPQPA